MSIAWKRVLIGGEVTVLAALTGVGVHLVLRPHNAVIAPPALTVPASDPAVRVSPAAMPRRSPSPSAAARARREQALSPGWFNQLGHEDRRQLATQWDILRSLIKGMERYLETRVIPDMEGRH